MATIRNPINLHANIDLLPTIQNIVPAYGLFTDAGIFREISVKTNQAIYEIEDQENARMTKLTSRTERDAVKVSRGKSKFVTAGGRTIKLTGGVHVEDLQNRLNKFDIDQDETLQEALAEETANVYNSFSQSFEYMLLTATQGKMRNPLDGSVAIDMHTITGTAQATATIDASPTSTTLLSGLNALRNQISQLNGYNGTVNEIELWVASDVFNVLVNHPEFITLYQWAFQGRGQEAVNNPYLNGSLNRYIQGKYGWYQEFRWENFVFRTYPQTFNAQNGNTLTAVANGKGWTVVRGVTNGYEVLYAPAPYFSTLNSLGQKIYARTTGIVDDTKLDFTIESHLLPMLKRPELAVDVTFTLT